MCWVDWFWDLESFELEPEEVGMLVALMGLKAMMCLGVALGGLASWFGE